MSNNSLNPAKLKCGPFFHKGGLIAVNDPIYAPYGFTGNVKVSTFEMKKG